MMTLKKIIEYGLYLLVFLLPWQTKLILRPGEIGGVVWEYGTISLYATDILLIGLLVLFLVYIFVAAKRNKSQDARTKQNSNYKIIDSLSIGHWNLFGFCFLVIGILVTAFISIFFSTDRVLAFFSFGRLVFGIGLFWLVVAAAYDKLNLILSFLSGLIFPALLGIWQFITQSSFAFKWLGLAMHDATLPGTSVIEVYKLGEPPERWLRAYGSFDHPNVLGGVMAVGLLMAISLLIRSVKNSKDARNKEQGTKGINNESTLRVTCYALCVIFSVALFFSFSRAAWLALIIGLVVMFTTLLIKKDKHLLLEFCVAIFFISATVAPMFFTYKDVAMVRVEARGRLETKSIDERLSANRQAVGLIKNNWLAGVGLGNYTAALAAADNKAQPAWAYQPVHNAFLLVFSEIGIVGLILFVLIIFNSLIFNFQFSISKQLFNCKIFKLFENCKLKIENWGSFGKNESLLTASPIIFAIIVIMLLDHWLWSLHFGIFLLWLVMGLAHKCPDKEIT